MRPILKVIIDCNVCHHLGMGNEMVVSPFLLIWSRLTGRVGDGIGVEVGVPGDCAILDVSPSDAVST